MNKPKTSFILYLLILLYLFINSRGYTQQAPSIVVQSSHSAVDAIFPSPDEKYILSQGDDQFKIWELISGRLVAFGPAYRAQEVLWQSDNNAIYFICSNKDGSKVIKKWLWQEERIVPVVLPSDQIPWGIIKSETKAYLLQIKFAHQEGNDVTLTAADIESQTAVFALTGPSHCFHKILAINEQNKLAISTGELLDGKAHIYVWDIQSNRIIQTIPIPTNVNISSISASLDAKYVLISGSRSPQIPFLTIYKSLSQEKINVKNIPKEGLISIASQSIFKENKLVFSINNFSTNTCSLYEYNIEKNELHILLNLSFPIRCFQLLKGSDAVLVGSSAAVMGQSSLSLFFITPNQAIKKGFTIVSETIENQLYLNKTGHISYGARLFELSGLYGTRANDHFILDVNENIAQRWSLLKSMPVNQFYVDSTDLKFRGFLLSDDGYFAIQHTKENTISIKQLDSGDQFLSILDTEIKGKARIASISSDRNHVITGDGFIPKLYGFFQQDEKKMLDKPSVSLWKDGTRLDLEYGIPAYKAGFSKDNKLCYACLGNRFIKPENSNLLGKYLIKIWKTNNGALQFVKSEGVHDKRGNEVWLSPVSVITISDDSRFLSFLSQENSNGFISIYDIHKNERILKKNIDLDFIDCAGDPSSLLFNKTGNSLLLGTTNSPPYLRKIDSRTGNVTHVFHEQVVPIKGGGNSLNFFQNDDYLVALGQDNIIRIFSMKTNALLTSSALFDNGNWISWTPNGYYKGSVEASEYVGWKYNKRINTFAQFRKKYYDPDFINKIMQTNKGISAHDDLSKPPTVTINSPKHQQNFPGKKCYINIVAEDDIEITNIKLYLNGRPVINNSNDTVLRHKKMFFWKHELSGYISLSHNINRIKVIAVDNEGNESTPVFADIYGRADMHSLPRLFVLSIGVSDYSEPLTDLRAASNDARMIANVFEKQHGKIYQDVQSKILIDKDADSEKIMSALTSLPEMTPNDVVVIFMAGHGIQDQNGIYYFCSYGTDISDLKGSGLNWAKFENIVSNFKAGKVILFLDTCHSGDILGRVAGDRFAENIARHSAIVFTSCKGIESSIEDTRLNHGIFTYALIRGINGEADLTSDGAITMSELRTYVEDRVPILAREYHLIQTPYTPRIERYVNFVISSIY